MPQNILTSSLLTSGSPTVALVSIAGDIVLRCIADPCEPVETWLGERLKVSWLQRSRCTLTIPASLCLRGMP